MAYVPLPEVSNLIEVYSSKNDFNGRDYESDSSEDIQKLKNEKGHNQKDEGNMEENLKNVSDTLSNEEDCSDQDLNEFNKEMELKINKKYCDADNSNNAVKKRFLNLVDSGSIRDSLYKTNKIFSNADNEYHSGSFDTDLHIAEHNNLKYKNLSRIIDSKSEDMQTGKSNNFPQMTHDTLNTIAESCQTSMHSESGKEKQSEDTESKEDTNKSNNLSQMTQDTISTTIGSYWALIDSESEEEKETENDTLITSKETFDSKSITKKSVKKKKSSIRASKDETMRQVHSKSQRLLREIEISLPYHKPKQRTLQEFLNRKKILAALPKASSTSAKLKMSSVIVSQVLAEKEKEAELFYKSSDSENDVQQSMPLVSKVIKKFSIINEKEPSINIDHISMKNLKETSTRDSQDKKEIVQKDDLNLNAPRYQIFEQDICKVHHQVVKLSSLTDNNSNLDDESDVLLPQTNEYNQNVSKFNLPRKLFDSRFENESNDSSEMNLGEQRATKGIVETFLNKEKYIDEKILITMTENQTSKMQEDDSEIINRRDKNLVTEAMKVSEILSNSINSKEITETFPSDNDVSDNVIGLNSDCTITQDRNNEKKDKHSEINDVLSLVINDAHSKIQDNPSTDKCEKFDHIQGLLFPEIAEKTLANRKKLSLVSNSKITLRGSPGMIIDLTDERDTKLNVKGVNTLLNRFFCKHVNTEKQSDKSEVTVVHLQNTQNSPLSIKEVLPYKVSVNTNNSELNKPGAKLKRLKEDLKLQMILKRNKEWKQKEINLQAQEEWNREEKNDYDLNEEEKSELGFELSDSEESEPEENDVCIKDKKRSKCLFADDEAEVTDNEDSSIEETCNESDTDHEKSSKSSKQSTSFEYRKEYVHDDVSEIETDQEDDEDKDEDEGKENESLDTNTENGNESDFKDDANVNVCKSFSIVKNKNDRKIKQLIEEFQDDSTNTNPSYLRNNNNQLNMVTDINTSKIYCEDNDWISENESNMPACQQYVEIATRSQICKTPLTKTSMLDLVSPITQLSVLNITLDSNKKDLSQKREGLDKHEFLSVENIQNESSERVCNIRNKSILKKKLFDDIGEIIDDEYLMQLCSGKFESTQRTDLDLFSQPNTTESQLCPSESELCSGNSNVIIDIIQSKNPKVNDKMLQDIKLTLDEDSNNSVNHTREIKKVTAIDSELKVTFSDDDNEDTLLKPVKKRSTKRLNLSDSEEENSQFSDEENNDVSKEETEEQYVDYDSEENEMIVVPEKDIKKIAADFLEEEAELSESDWDSADEDEKDLDKLEFEEADDEHIDEHEIKNQLGKIHMKQILDEDKREVRLLKELLFEDGDLHTDGTGRERKFKWKNIDKLGNNIEIPQISENDGWVDVPEDEEEVKWSKFRHERDKFLEERMKCLNNEIEDELCDSQIFKLGLEAVKKIKDNELQRQDTSFDKIENISENMEPIMPRNITDFLNRPNIGKKSQMICNVIKKRSLLTRGEKSLAKIASLAKQGDSASYVVNTRNFVFPHIDHSINNTFKKENELIAEDLDSQIKPKKRKMISNMSSTSKKRRK